MKKIISFVLALILAFPTTAFAAGTPQDNMSIDLSWVGTSGTEYNLVESRDISTAVKLRVGYHCGKVRAEGYAASELIITVKGIGGVNRSGAIEAMVGADKVASTAKRCDWSYTWNKANDTYTLTNNEPIAPNSVLSGYFELVWDIKARESIHNYAQDGIQAILYLPNGSSVQSPTLSFTNKTTVDTFTVDIERHEMYSYEGLTSGISNPNDYAFVRYNLGVGQGVKSRGTTKLYYTFSPDAEIVGSGAIVISPVTTCTSNGDGTYRVSLYKDTPMSKQYVFVAYPRSTYTDKTIKASLEAYGAFYEEDQTATLLDDDFIQLHITADFTFTDPSGGGGGGDGSSYTFAKDTYYDKYVASSVIIERGGDLSGSKMVSGTTQTFYLDGSYSNTAVSGRINKMEMVDDFLYILKNDGTYRQLGVGEYEFEKVTIPGTTYMLNNNNLPIASDTYGVRVYAFTNGAVANTDTDDCLVFSGKLMRHEQPVALPANTTAVAVILSDLSEKIQHFSIPVSVKFHIDNSEGQDNLTDGQLINTAFIRFWDNDGNWLNNNWTEENYVDETSLGLAQKDMSTYGHYLDRERDNITFYTGERNDYKSYTDISNITDAKADYTIGANFYFYEDAHPNKFSLYSILPASLSLDGYSMLEDIWDIMSLSGLGLTSKQLANACTPEIIQDYKGSGRTYIGLHFDFGSKEIQQSSQIRATFPVKVDKEYMKSSFTIATNSCVMIDSNIAEYSIGKTSDTGDWGGTKALFSDIDRDGNTTETLASSYDYVSHVYADSSQFSVYKHVKTSYSDEWVQLPDVPAEKYGGTYQYRLSIKNGNNTSSNIVIQDDLESGANAQWQGRLERVELVGLSGTVYYSTGDGNWSTTKPESIKAVKVDFGDAILDVGKTLAVILHMTAPSDEALKDKVTENLFHASFTMVSSTTGNESQQDMIASNAVQVSLTPALESLVVKKVDEVDGSPLAGAVFCLIDKATGVEVAEVTTNVRGYAIFHGISSESTYTLREKTAPRGYLTTADRDISLSSGIVNITVEDERKDGCIEVHKVNRLASDVGVADAEYTLFDSDDNVVGTATTNAQGVATFDGLAWGDYVVKETAAPVGYQLNDTEYPVTINQDNADDAVVVDTDDAQDDVSVQMTKYESTIGGIHLTNPLPGATFELVRVSSVGEKRIGLYVTDSAGKITLSELPYGNYYFREYRTPAGYVMAEDKSFAITPSNKDVDLTVYNQRKPGSIIISKKDNLGNLVQGVEFTLYDESRSNAVAISTTDEYGSAQFSDLEWGTYYLVETDGPDYYELSSDWREVIVGGQNLQIYIGYVNETGKGAVVLTKTDETGQNVLPGAGYSLYKDDGTLLGSYITDALGQISVNGLEWGSYYFKETKPPTGYGLSNEMVRFSVNALNAKLTQYINVVDPLDAKGITITKRLIADGINFDNGNPIFTFKLTGTDVNGVDHTYYQTVAFSKQYVENNTDSSGYVSQSITFSGLTAGMYEAFEMPTSRYYLESISDVTNGVLNGESVYLDIINTDSASATFTNRAYEYQNYSDAQNLVNILKEQTRFTTLKASYGSKTAEALTSVDTDLLTVLAIYDDGSSRTLSTSEYTLSITEFPNVNGDYTITVTHSEKGITRTATFTVTLYGMHIRVIGMSANVKDTTPVLVNSVITSDMFTVEAVYNDGTSRILEPNEFTVSPNKVRPVDGQFEVTIDLDLGAIPNDGYPISTKAGMSVKYAEPVLETGTAFNAHIPDTATSVVFTDVEAPADVDLIDVSAAKEGGVMAWENGTTFYVSSQRGGIPVIANADSSSMFYKKTALTGIDFNHLDTSSVTNMYYLFNGCTGLTSLDISKFNTSSVTNMQGMFVSCTGLTSLDISNFNTSSVTNMAEMFNNCTGLDSLDVSSFNTSSVTNMRSMFRSCINLTSLDLSTFNTSSVTDMVSMFNNCKKMVSLDVSSFDTSKVTNMVSMFMACNKLSSLDVSNFDTGKVTSMNGMFGECLNLTSLDLCNFDTSSVTDMAYMFGNCQKLNSLDLKSFNTSFVTNMKQMFTYCSNLTSLNVRSFDTSRVTNMVEMFYACAKLTVIDLSSFDTGSLINSTNMFNLCYAITTIYASELWSTDKLTYSAWMFCNCTKLVGGNGTKHSGAIVTKTYARIDTPETPGYFTYMAAPVPFGSTYTSVGGTVYAAGQHFPTIAEGDSFAQGDYTYTYSSTGWVVNPVVDKAKTSYSSILSEINGEPVTSLQGTFAGCTSMTTAPTIPNSVTNMADTFNGCTSLTGNIVLHINPDVYDGCFANTTELIVLLGASTELSGLAVTANNGNVSVGLYTSASGAVYKDSDSLPAIKAGDTYAYGDYTYTYSSAGWKVNPVSDKTKATYSAILSEINGKPVTSVYQTFSGCTSLTNAPIIPSSVTNMESAFNNCTSLTAAPEIPSSVTNMYKTFKGCTSLTTAPEIPSSVTEMGGAFQDCTSLTTAPEVPSSVTSMRSTFYGCKSLTTTPEVPSSVTNMESAFYNCTSLTTAPEIPSSVTTMSNTFYGCTSLTTAPEIPSSVTTMYYTFYNCISLTTAPAIPTSVTNMAGAFWGCKSLTGNVTINASPSSYDVCFKNTAQPIVLYGSSTKLAALAATGNNGNVTVGSTESGSYAANSGTIYHDGDTLPAASVGDVYFLGDYSYTYSSAGWAVNPVADKTKTTYSAILSEINGEPVTSMLSTFSGCASITTSPEIPNGVTDMSYTFYKCASLVASPEIPSSVKNMFHTFHGCTTLTAAPTIPSSVTNMSYALCSCTALTAAPEIPGNVTDLQDTFSGCTAMMTAPSVIPSSVTNMKGAFWNCKSLTGHITIDANPVTFAQCFQNTTKPITISGDSTKLDALVATANNRNVTKVVA